MIFRVLKKRMRLASIGLVALLIASQQAGAATVLQLGVADLIDGSELIVHGHVVERWTSYDDQRQTVFTHVRIAIDEVIKGSPAGDEVVLQFEGGRHGRLIVSVSDMNLPIAGEEGVYFIEKPDRVQVNPLLGWQQGHFVVRHSEDGLDKLVHTYDLRPVFGVSDDSADSGHGVSEGISLGILTEPSGADQPLSLSTFKNELRELVEVRQ